MPAEPTYTYSFNPATDTKDAVRALIADHNQDGKGWLLSDQEVLFAITSEGSPRLAAAMCAEMIAGMFTGPKRNIIELRIGDLQKSSPRNSAADDYYDLAKTLRARARRGAVPVAGGVELTDRQDRTDTSLLQPEFARGMDNFIPNDRNDLGGADPPRLP